MVLVQFLLLGTQCTFDGFGGYVAQQRAITVGDVAGNSYVVVSGVTAGEQVVVGGIQKIGDGMPIAAKAPAAPEGGK